MQFAELRIVTHVRVMGCSMVALIIEVKPREDLVPRTPYYLVAHVDPLMPERTCLDAVMQAATELQAFAALDESLTWGSKEVTN